VTYSNPIRRLEALGQSIWLDYIRRDLVRDGELLRLIDTDGVSGLTSNPDIFEKAIAESRIYDPEIAELAAGKADARTIYETLCREDVRIAADAFRSLYDRSDGRDGFVSIEINPHLAHDTEATFEEGQRLWSRLARPNVLIKVPATNEGLSAIRRLVAAGVGVNATLIFGLPRYLAVAEAYLAGIEERAFHGQPLNRPASVASFYIGRIDALVDPKLDALVAKDAPGSDLARRLRGRAAIASAKVAYHAFQDQFRSPRFRTLEAQGARVQRLLWASTAAVDPLDDELKYVEALIGASTINTVPLRTLEAYRERGEPEARLEAGLAGASEVLSQLEDLGILLGTLAGRLEQEGVVRFTHSFDVLMESLLRASPPV